MLVPLDGSDLANRILTPLRRLLDTQEVKRITLLHIEEERDATGERDEGIARVRELLPETRVLVEFRDEQGDPAGRILAVAEELAPDLIAMATHGLSGVARWVRGSVAERVLRHSTVPLFLANPHAIVPDAGASAGGFRRILAPLDGSRVGAGILPLLVAVARLHDAEVVLLAVENVRVPGPPHLRPRGESAVLASLEPFRASLQAAGVEAVRLVAETGAASLKILEVAEREQADLVALSTHGRSGPSRWVFGSVAEQVLRECRLPLLVRRVAPLG